MHHLQEALLQAVIITQHHIHPLLTINKVRADGVRARSPTAVLSHRVVRRRVAGTARRVGISQDTNSRSKRKVNLGDYINSKRLLNWVGLAGLGSFLGGGSHGGGQTYPAAAYAQAPPKKSGFGKGALLGAGALGIGGGLLAAHAFDGSDGGDDGGGYGGDDGGGYGGDDGGGFGGDDGGGGFDF
jgi:hypothetical protein